MSLVPHHRREANTTADSWTADLHNTTEKMTVSRRPLQHLHINKTPRKQGMVDRTVSPLKVEYIRVGIAKSVR